MTSNLEFSNITSTPLLLSHTQLNKLFDQTKQHEQKGFYLLYDYLVETKPKHDSLNSHDIYLAGHHQLHNKVKIFAAFEDESLFNQLTYCSSIKQLIYGMGIYVYSNDTTQLDVIFETKQGEDYHQVRIPCPTNGYETFIKLTDFNWTDANEQLHKLSFESDTAKAIASVSIVFYTYDSFHYPKLTYDQPIDFESPLYSNMIEKSLTSLGNTTRLKQAIDKAKRGEDVTIAYIGGSITQGAVALPLTNCYAYQSYLKFKEMYGQNGGDHIHFIKAGVGGTPSELGMIRYERDILKNGKAHPDILIVEFAVNDADDETNGISYESLVVRALCELNMPAVVLLFSVFFDDWNLQDRLSAIGTRYQLPMVSIKDAVVEQFYKLPSERQILTKRQFFYDIYHPSNAGHRIMADCLAHLFKQVELQDMPYEDIDLAVPAVYGTDFTNIKLIDRINLPNNVTISRGGFSEIDNELQGVELDINTHTTPQFPYNWSKNSESSSESFIMNLTCKKLLLVFKDSGDSQFGQVDILINNQLFKQLNAHEVKWNHCHTVLLINEQFSQQWDIEIKMSEEHLTKSFTILAFGYVA